MQCWALMLASVLVQAAPEAVSYRHPVAGSVLLLAYATHQRDAVIVLGQLAGGKKKPPG